MLSEFGVQLNEEQAVHVHDSTADMRYIVLPMRPAGTEGWSAEQLMALLHRDALVGAGLPVEPSQLSKGGL